MHANFGFCDWRTPQDVNNGAGDQAAQVKSSIEAVGKCAEVLLGVFSVFQGMESTRQGGLVISAVEITAKSPIPSS
jgi:hypothetical protein